MSMERGIFPEDYDRRFNPKPRKKKRKTSNRLAPTLPVSATRASKRGPSQREMDEYSAQVERQVQADREPKQVAEVLKSCNPFCKRCGYRVVKVNVKVNNAIRTGLQVTVARKLSGYDDATWSRLREDRKRTYRRAADSLITQWPEFAKLFEVKP